MPRLAEPTPRVPPGAPSPLASAAAYERRLADLPWHGYAVAIELRVRRFFCQMPGCARRIFCEHLRETTEAHARRTLRFSSALELIGLALGGETGARLAHGLGLASARSADTLLRLIKASPTIPESEPPVVRRAPLCAVGVDDRAWRKGGSYGTIMVDLERHRVADLLPDREPRGLAAWLERHPTIEFISRDRAGGYADGATRGAPRAIQVANRFHLLKNLTEALQRSL